MLKDSNILFSPEWRKLRKYKLSISPVCEVCLKKGIATEGTEVDHIKPRVMAPELTFELSNLQTLCFNCHCEKTNAENSNKPIGIVSAKWKF